MAAKVKMTTSWRVISFFFVVFVLPTLLISVPLYARYQLYPTQSFLTTDGDVFALHSTVSSFWCQGQKVSANGSFEAYQTTDAIYSKASNRRDMSLKSTLVLQHDDAEEWGFYLVKGSSFTFSACARWPGGTLIVVKGEENLRKCFYREERLIEELNGDYSHHVNPFHPTQEGQESIRIKYSKDKLLDEDSENMEDRGGEIFDDELSTGNFEPGTLDDFSAPVTSSVTHQAPQYSLTREELNNRIDNDKISKVRRIISPVKNSKTDVPLFHIPLRKWSSVGAFSFNDTIEVTAGNSSFSSSEEFMRHCTRTVASIELNPYSDCNYRVQLSKDNADRWKFRVNESDYYFFIFASDNSLEANIIHFKLLLKRTLYNVSHSISHCSNSSECVFAFPFLSKSGVILDVKGSYDKVSHLEDLQSYEVVSVCQPRFIVYTVLILLVPFVIVLFAFR